MKYVLDINIELFNNDTFSKKDAFRWLVINSTKGTISFSLRNAATIWQWHYSAVKRFLDVLDAKQIISISHEKKHRSITILNYEQYFVLKQDCNSFSNKEYQGNQVSSIDSETDAETILQQNDTQNYKCNNACNNEGRQIASVQDINETTTDTMLQQSASKSSSNSICNSDSQYFRAIHNDNETACATNLATKEEKKKRSKKRKEENIKEKNIPYRDTKKEKISKNKEEENSGKLIPAHLVAMEDIELWARDVNGTEHIDLAWELNKFKDYWLATAKKQPKDGVAAFRNWIRRSIEITTKEDKHDRFSRNTKPNSTSFERFLAGGARALASHTRNRLDWPYDREKYNAQ